MTQEEFNAMWRFCDADELLEEGPKDEIFGGALDGLLVPTEKSFEKVENITMSTIVGLGLPLETIGDFIRGMDRIGVLYKELSAMPEEEFARMAAVYLENQEEGDEWKKGTPYGF